MEYNIFLKCDNCGYSCKISRERAEDLVHSGLRAAKMIGNRLFKKMYYPVILCKKCDYEFLVDENMVFERK